MINLFLPQKIFAYTSLEKEISDVAQQLGAQGGGSALGILLNQIMFIVIGVAIVLAIFAIVRGGFEYMTSSDSDDKKSRAKNRIQAAFGGLLLAVSSILILNTINTGITSFDISLTNTNSFVPSRINTASNSYDPEVFLRDGLQSTDSFFAGENDVYANKILEMSDDELVELVKKQLDGGKGFNDYREFIIELKKDRDYYANGANTNSPEIIKEIARMDSLLNKFASIDSKLDSDGPYQQAALIYNQRQVLGIINSRGQQNSNFSVQSTQSFTNGGNLSAHSMLFALDDSEVIQNIYSASGGNSLDNSYSLAIVDVLNNPQQYQEQLQNVSLIQSWVDKNGETIGIKKTESGYALLD